MDKAEKTGESRQKGGNRGNRTKQRKRFFETMKSLHSLHPFAPFPPFYPLYPLFPFYPSISFKKRILSVQKFSVALRTRKVKDMKFDRVFGWRGKGQLKRAL